MPAKNMHQNLKMNPETIQLSQAILDTFAGGQLEILSNRGKTIYRVGIKTATMSATGGVEIVPNWVAKGESHMVPGRWTKTDSTLSCDIDHRNYTTRNIGQSINGGSDRIVISMGIRDKIFTFFPSNGRMIDPAQVRGLTIE